MKCANKARDPGNAEDFVADQLAKLQAAFPTVRLTRLVRVNDGRVIANPATLNGNGLLAIHDLIEYDRQTDNFINDFRLNWENDMALLTLGFQSWLVDTINPAIKYISN